MLYETRDAFRDDLERIEDIYPSFFVLSKLARLIRNPDISLEDLVEQIEVDPSLTADVISAANSPYYGYTDRTADVQEAVQRIGFDEVNRIVGICLARRVGSSNLSHYKLRGAEIFATNLSGALLMHELANVTHLEDDGDAHTTGLLAHVGKVILNALLTDSGSTANWNRQDPVEEWEKSVCGVNHAEAGSDMLRRWDFPDAVCDAIETKVNRPSDPAKAEPLSRLLILTEAIQEHCGDTLGSPESVQLLSEPVAALSKLKTNELQELVDSQRQKLAGITSSLGVG